VSSLLHFAASLMALRTRALLTLPTCALVLTQLVVASPLPTLRDHPIAAGSALYLDGQWTLTSAPLISGEHTKPTPPGHCNVSSGCCFQSGIDWKPVSGPDSGRPQASASAEECCAACAAYGDKSYDDGCYVAVFLNNRGQKQCWFKSKKDAAGGSYNRSGDNRVSCMPKTRPLPPPSPPHSIVGTVPGDLISDLQVSGLVDDPYFEMNWLNSSLWANNLWTYSTSFSAVATSTVESTTATPSTATWLVFDGIKMGATVYIDGVLVGTATDQFRRYAVPVPNPSTASATHHLRVVFDPRIPVGGRFMGCSGGWDWAPYTNTENAGALTFSSGIWKSVYTVNVASFAITYLVPTVHYLGSDPTSPLEDGTHAGFMVAVKVFVKAAGPDTAARAFTVKAAGSWGSNGATSNNSSNVYLAAGVVETTVTIWLAAPATDVELWYPNGAGKQPLYNVTASVVAANNNAVAVATRQIGFRTFALVTGGGRKPGSEYPNGTMVNGLVFRVNGAATFSRGANMVPMEELDGRMRADSL
jgi:hypothetical protein